MQEAVNAFPGVGTGVDGGSAVQVSGRAEALMNLADSFCQVWPQTGCAGESQRQSGADAGDDAVAAGECGAEAGDSGEDTGDSGEAADRADAGSFCGSCRAQAQLKSCRPPSRSVGDCGEREYGSERVQAKVDAENFRSYVEASERKVAQDAGHALWRRSPQALQTAHERQMHAHDQASMKPDECDGTRADVGAGPAADGRAESVSEPAGGAPVQPLPRRMPGIRATWR